MKVLKRIIEIKGIPKAIYTDRAGWAGGPKRTEFSQFQKACTKLGIQVIFANTPEAKGRIERSFRTIQDRLIPELRHNKVKTMEDANSYLQNTFLAEYWNKQKAIMPANPESAYLKHDPFQFILDDIFVTEETRVINTDQTINFKAKRYLVEKDGTNLSRYEAVIRTRLDESTKVYVMENEVTLTALNDFEVVQEPKKKRKRYKNLCEVQDAEIIRLIEAFHDDNSPLSYINMWRLISQTSDLVREHLVFGKPLKVKRPYKKAA